MTENYIRNNYREIIKYENIIEKRKEPDSINLEDLVSENLYNLEMCKKYKNKYILIDDNYDVNFEL